MFKHFGRTETLCFIQDSKNFHDKKVTDKFVIDQSKSLPKEKTLMEVEGRIIILFTLLNLITLSTSTVCFPWRYTSVVAEKINHTIFFTISSASRTGWSGFGFGQEKEIQTNSYMIFFSLNSVNQITNHSITTINKTKIFTNEKHHDSFNLLVDNQKTLTFELEESKLFNQNYLFFVEGNSNLNISNPIHTKFETRKLNLSEEINKNGK